VKNIIITRRKVLTSTAAAAVTLGMPSIVRAAESVKLGFVTALTGLEAVLGVPQLNMMTMATDEINEQGGIGGRKLEYVVEDTQTSTQAVVDRSRKVIFQDNVDALFGLIATTELAAALTVTVPAKKLQFFPIYYPGGECHKYAVFTGQVAEQQILPMMPWLVESVGKRHYVMGSDFSWGRRSSQIIEASLKELGGEYLGAEFFPFGVQDLGQPFQKIHSLKPDVVWFFFAGSDAITAVKQYHDFGLEKVARVVSDAWDEVFLGSMPAEPQTGIITNQAYFDILDNPVNKAFVERYRKRYGEDKRINATMESAYIAIWLYAKAVEKAGSTNTEAVLKALPEVDFEAPQGGRVSISALNNHMRANSIAAQVTSEGAFEIIKQYGQIDPIVPGCDLQKA